MTSCKAIQHSDQMVCECGNIWDMNDPDPPHCNPPKKPGQQVGQEPVGWQFFQGGKWWYGDDRIKNHRKNTEAVGIPTRDVYAAPPGVPDLQATYDAIKDATVSVDVSTGEDDAFNRLYGKVYGIQPDGEGMTILVCDTEANFDAPAEQDVSGMMEVLDLLKEAHDELVTIKAAIGFRVNTLALIERIGAALSAHREQQGGDT